MTSSGGNEAVEVSSNVRESLSIVSNILDTWVHSNVGKWSSLTPLTLPSNYKLWK